MNLYRDRGGGGSKGGEMLDRKRINDALDKHLEKSSPSTSRNKGSAVAVPSTSSGAGEHIDPKENRSSSTLATSNNKLSDGVQEQRLWKTLLQQYTQRASMPLPVYKTLFEGTPYAPTFRTEVWVDGTCFTSRNSFLSRKMAEQDAAKFALIGIREKVKSEGSSLILQDTVFCKSIINEYASKMNLKPPTYVTNETQIGLPIFVSSLILNGVTYVGDAGKNKKEAAQFAARSAVLSILDSESSTTMSEIVKSKFRLYDALKKVKDSCSIQSSIMATGINSLEDIDLSNAQGSRSNGMNPLEDTSAPFSLELPATELQSLHESEKPKCQSSLDPPTVFVPPASEQALICSTSGKKRKRKNKKDKKKVEHESRLPIVTISSSLVPGCSVAQ